MILSHLVFDCLMEFNGWYVTFENSCSSALFLSVETLVIVPDLVRYALEFLPLKK